MSGVILGLVIVGFVFLVDWRNRQDTKRCLRVVDDILTALEERVKELEERT